MERCGELDKRFKLGPLGDYLGKLTSRSSDIQELITCATVVEERLRKKPGQWRSWLSKTVGTLQVTDRTLVACLGRIAGNRIATTNYDTILSDVIGQPAVSWRDQALVSEIAREQSGGVLHFHGHHRDAESVVLGYQSYARVVHNSAIQEALRALVLTKTLVFVGVGDGLIDPNIGSLLDWFGNTQGVAAHTHYYLTQTSELERFQTSSLPVVAIEYGESHDHLLPFLIDLEQDVARGRQGQSRVTRPSEITPPIHPELLRAGSNPPQAPSQSPAAGGRSSKPPRTSRRTTSELAFINDFREYCERCTDMIQRAKSDVRTMQTPSQVEGDSALPFEAYLKATANRIVRQRGASGLTSYRRLIAIDASCFEQEKRKLVLFFDEVRAAINAAGPTVSIDCLALCIVHREEMARMFHSNLDVHITSRNECALAFHLGHHTSDNYWQTCLYARLGAADAAHKLIASFDAVWDSGIKIKANRHPGVQIQRLQEEAMRALRQVAFRETNADHSDTNVSIAIRNSRAFSNAFFVRARNQDIRRGSLESLVSEWYAVTRAFAFCSTRYVARLASDCYEGQDLIQASKLVRALQIASSISAGEFGLGMWGSNRNGVHYKMFGNLGQRVGVPQNRLEQNPRGTWPETRRVISLFETHLGQRLAGAGVLCTIEQTAYRIVDAMQSLFPGENEYIALHMEIETTHAALADELCLSVMASDGDEAEIVKAASDLCEALGSFWGRMATAVFDGVQS